MICIVYQILVSSNLQYTLAVTYNEICTYISQVLSENHLLSQRISFVFRLLPDFNYNTLRCIYYRMIPVLARFYFNWIAKYFILWNKFEVNKFDEYI